MILIVAWAAVAVLISHIAGAAEPAPGVSFRTAARVPLGDTPGGLTVFDLDGDGDLDVAITHFFNSGVSVLLNDGAGGLTPVADSPAGGAQGGRGIAAGRFDADAIPDLVITEAESDNMWFLAGHGNGTFGPPKLITGGFHDPLALFSMDFDGDGKLDLVQSIFSELGGRVNVFISNGDGTFAPLIGARTSGGNLAAAVADFNNDHFLDLAAPNYSPAGTVSVALNRGDGTFGRRIDSPVGGAPAAIAAGKIDADEFVDVVVANQNDDTMTFSRGVGDGTLDTPRPFAVGHGPFGIALSDLDGDQALDAVVSNSLSSSVSVLLGSGTGDFMRARHFVADAGPVAVVVANLDHDELPDVITANQGTAQRASVTVLSGRGATPTGVEHLATTSNTAAGAVAVGDVDNDGLPDIAATFAADHTVGVYFAVMGGGFTAPLTLPINLQGQPVGVVVADVNGDDWPDVVTANSAGSDLSLLLNRRGHFDDAVGLSAGGPTAALIVADLNHDGRADVAASLPGTNQVAILSGNGDGTFAPATTFATQVNPGALASGDFNHDGFPDLAVVNRNSGSVSILLGNAGGGFTIKAPVSVDIQPTGIAVFNVNGDGSDDFAVSHAGGTVRVLVSDGNGGFSAGATLHAQDNPSGIAARDLNGDQRADLIVANQGTPSVSVFADTGSGTFAAPVNFLVTSLPTSASAADFTSSGDYDVVVSGTHPAIATNLASTNVRRGDGTGDGRVNAADLVAGASETLRSSVPVEHVRVAALDANGDGIVNGQDQLAVARRVFGRLSQLQ